MTDIQAEDDHATAALASKGVPDQGDQPGFGVAANMIDERRGIDSFDTALGNDWSRLFVNAIANALILVGA